MNRLAVTFDECLRWARARDATVKAIIAALGCTRYRFYRMRNSNDCLSRFVILAAANQIMMARGTGFQTTLIHFTGRTA